MNKTKNSPPISKDAEEKEVNALDRILESNACKRLFTWARPPQNSDDTAEAAVAQMKEEQKLRWNFDFQTETPLPGRYQWVRTDVLNGHQENGHANKTDIQNGDVVERRTSRQRLNAPYFRKSRTTSRIVEEHSSSNPRSAGSCDRSLNGPRRSERNSQVQLNDAPYGPWNIN